MARNTGRGSRVAAEQNRRESDYIPSVAEFRVSYRVTHADLDSTESIERADAAFERGVEQVRAAERAKRPDREQMIYRARATEGEVVGPERTSPEMAKEAYWQALALHPFDMEDETPLVESRPQVPWRPLALEPEAREDAEYFRDRDGDLWKLTDKGEWFHEEESGEFRRVLSIDAEDQGLNPVSDPDSPPAPEAREEPLIDCPHWERGRLTKRKGCTACAAEAREVTDARRITKPEFDIALGHFRAVFNDRSLEQRGSRPALLAALKSLGIAVTDG